MTRAFFRAALLASIAAPFPLFAQSVQQSSDVPAAAEQNSGEIVVTARRRSETLQNVPIAISVLAGKDLTNSGAFNVQRIQQQQPSLQFYSSNPRNTAINIRGLGAPFGLTNDGIEQGVGFYVDGVYIGRVGASTFDLVDIDRVEVLRGPQGTLYGKNTTAGAINITTRALSFEPEARVEASAGNYNFFQGKASVSGPITDNVAVRLSTALSTRDGTIQNVKSGLDLHRLSNLGVKGSVLWNIDDTANLTLFADFNRQNPLCCVQYYARVAPTQRASARQFAMLAANAGYTVPSTNPFDRVTDLDASINSRQEVGGVSLVGNWDLGFATFTSVTAYRYWDWTPANDRDFTGLPITIVSQNPSQQRQYTQEIRLASNGKDKISYTVGAFFFHQTIDTQGSQVQGSRASAWLLNPASAGGLNPNTLDGLTSTNAISFRNESFAVFGKANWAVTEAFHIQPGLRLNYDKKSGSYVAVVSINNPSFPNRVATCANPTALNADQLNTLAPQCYSPDFDNWNVSGDLTLSYDFARDVHGYATYAHSFKSGGINLSGLPLNSTNTSVDLTTQTVKPERVNHYELGLKTQFADRRVTLNLAAFWTDIEDYQATVNSNAVNVIRGYLANAGRVRARGFEFDSSFRPSPRFNAYINGAYTDARYADFRNAPCPPELSGGAALPVVGGVIVGTPAAAGTPGNSLPYCDISGQVLPGISKWAFSWGGEFNLAVGSGDAQVYVGYDANYRSDFSSNPSQSAYMQIDGYALHNFRAGYRKGEFNAFAWVRNAFKQNYFELLSTQSGSSGLIVGQPGDPRTYGVTLSASF